MNNNRKNFIATLLFAALFSMVLPWWGVMLAALLSTFLFPLKKNCCFLCSLPRCFPFLGSLLLCIGKQQ